MVQASFVGKFPGETRIGHVLETGFLYSTTPYSEKVPLPIHFALASSLAPNHLDPDGSDGAYEVSFDIPIESGECKQLSLFFSVEIHLQAIEKALSGWAKTLNLLEAIRQNWNEWFDQEIPRFQCSNSYFEKLYYYRWWSHYTKMIFAQVGHFLYPAPREGTAAFNGIVSYSSAYVSVDELRWMRRPDWAFSTTREFFVPANLNDGYLSNHIWDWGIDGDESNQDSLGRSVRYVEYNRELGLVVRVDGVMRAKAPGLQRVVINP